MKKKIVEVKKQRKMTFVTKTLITFSKVTGPYKYQFQMLKGLKLRLNMPGVFLTPVCHRRVNLTAYFKMFSGQLLII